LKRAAESYAKLQVQMEATERKQKETVEQFNQSAVEAKLHLRQIEEDTKRKTEQLNRTIEKI